MYLDTVHAKSLEAYMYKDKSLFFYLLLKSV